MRLYVIFNIQISHLSLVRYHSRKRAPPTHSFIMCFLFVFFSKRKQYYPLQRKLFKLSKSKVQQFTAIVVSPNGQGVGTSSSAYYTLAFTNSFIFIYFVFNSEMKPYNIFLTTILVAACVFIFIKIFKFCLFV